jgi:hypothetical protein
MVGDKEGRAAGLPPYVVKTEDGRYRLRVWVQPGAKQAGLAGTYQDCLKVKLTAPPVDNKANRELVAFLAARLGLKPRNVSLVGGHSARKKVVDITMGKNTSWSL